MAYDLGAAIRTARLAVGLTQAQVGAHMGLRQTAVQAWESGQNTPDARQLLALQELFGARFGASSATLSPDAAYLLGEAVGELRSLSQIAAAMADRAETQAASIDARRRALTLPDDAIARSDRARAAAEAATAAASAAPARRRRTGQSG